MNASEKNLMDFYRELGIAPSVLLVKNEHFSAISENTGSWPQMVFDFELTGGPEVQLKKVLTQSVQLNLPHFAVSNTELFASENQYMLSDSGIYPVHIWTLMEKEIGEQPFKSGRGRYDIRKLVRAQELEAFTRLVNTELLQSLNINLQLVEELAGNSKFHFYGLFVENVLVSGLLAFSEQHVAGLYFIVTQSQKRGNGFASELIRFVMNELYTRGTKKVVLHSVLKAVPLYVRLGFNSCGKLGIFWKR